MDGDKGIGFGCTVLQFEVRLRRALQGFDTRFDRLVRYSGYRSQFKRQTRFRAINSYSALLSKLKCAPKSRLLRHLSVVPMPDQHSMVWQGSCLTGGMSIDEMEWQKLCKSVAEEHDPQRLLALVDQLIEALSARRDALRDSKPPRKPGSGSATGNKNE
jgi:hypothetical protein